MSKIIVEKMQQKMEELSLLEEEIKSKIEKYNKLSTEVDNSCRMALLTAESYKNAYDEDEDTSDMTHENFIRHVADRPTSHIYRPNATAWFPSSIC
jgi:hypothetical protein